MSERERHSKRRSRQEDLPDPDDRYDPKQGAKRSRKAEVSPDLGQPLAEYAESWCEGIHLTLSWLAGPPRRPVREDPDFSDR